MKQCSSRGFFTISTNSTGVVMIVLFIIFRQTVHCLPGICFVQIDTKNVIFHKKAVIINVNYQLSDGQIKACINLVYLP